MASHPCSFWISRCSILAAPTGGASLPSPCGCLTGNWVGHWCFDEAPPAASCLKWPQRWERKSWRRRPTMDPTAPPATKALRRPFPLPAAAF